MPPRRSDQLQAAEAPACNPFAALPHALLLALLALLPVDQRLRCAEVCRGWRALLSDASLWLRLDLSPAGGVAHASEALLHAATARAGGGLQALDLTGCSRMSLYALLEVAEENSAALVELRMAALDDTTDWKALSSRGLEQLLRAAPQLRVLVADARCHGMVEARRLLRNEAPFGPLRVRKLRFSADFLHADAVHPLIEDAAAHTWLTGLKLYRTPHDLHALDAVVDAALQLRLTYVELNECDLGLASAPPLARLLGGAFALKTLVFAGEPVFLLTNEPAAARLLLSNALRANTTLTSATFNWFGLFNDAATSAALLGALTGHPSLRKLDVSSSRAYGLAAPAGVALAALVAANAPALHELHMNNCWLGDAALGPLVDALPHNTHLRILNCSMNHLSEAFKRDRLRPAVRANPWLKAIL
jgi:hypothetical protein